MLWFELRGCDLTVNRARFIMVQEKNWQGIHVFPVLLQLILGLPQVEACAVALFEATRLLAFVVPSTSGDQKEASPLTSAQKHPERTPSASAVSHHQGETGGADGDLRRLILNQLSLLLPSHSVPDTLVQVPALCLTPHGEH